MNLNEKIVRKALSLVQRLMAFVVIIAVVVTGRYMVKAQPLSRFDVFLDDQLVGTVSDPEVVNQWKSERYREMERQYENVRVTSNLERLRFAESGKLQGLYDNDAVLAVLSNKIIIALFAVEIRIDGKTVGFVKDRDAANELLDQIKAPYLEKRKSVEALSAEVSASSPSTVGTTAYFVQNIELVDTAVAPGKLESAETLLSRITEGEVEPMEYIVKKGDCLSLIAKQFDLSLDEIRADNPDIRKDLIRVGQTIKLTAKKPLLSVKTTETRTEQVKIPSSIIYEKDDELKAGVIQIKVQGKPGRKEITVQKMKVNGIDAEETVVDERIVEEQVKTVVLQGTKKVPGVGTGKFATPVIRPKVTSEYGLRWGRSHNGTDLVSDQKAILAADNGQIIFAGIKPGYGYCIVIDHQNGFETLYGHLSKLEIRQGELVTKGEKIGVMGSTGNATGVHLHFEIHRNGQLVNPMQYLQI